MRSIDIDRIEAPYSIVPHPTVVFEQMAPVQWAGLNALVSRDLAKIENGYVSQDIDRLFSLFGKIKSEHHYLDLKVLGFFMNNYFGHSLQGMNGLKARTGLMEHKYDAA